MSYASKHFAVFFALICAICSLVVLQGCGGGGGGTQQTGFQLTATPISAQIQAPAGFPVTDLTTLTAWSSGGTTPLTGGGQSTITIFNNGPQYSDIRDSEGRLVFANYLSSADPIFDEESTAAAMIFFAIGGGAQIGDGPKAVWDAVPTLAGFGAVVDEVRTQLTTQGYVSLQTGNLKNVIDDIIDTFGTPPAKGRGTIAEPSSASGLFLDTITDGEFKIQQNYLRRTRGWLRRLSYTMPGGSEVESLTEFKKFDIEVPNRYGGFNGAVYGILTGDMTWTPTVSEPFQIPLAPVDAEETTYELRTFGIGASAGNLTNLTQDELDELVSLEFKSLILDAILPVIANIVLPLNGDAMDEFLDFASSDALIADLINLSREALPEVTTLLREGKLREAIVVMWDSGFTTNSALPIVLQVIVNFAETKAGAEIFAELGDIGATINKRLDLLGYVDVFFSSADMAIFTSDYLRSDRANRFVIRTTSGKATLVPESLLVSVFDTTLINAVIQNKNPDAVYKYEWTVSPGYKLTTSNGNTSEAPGGVLVSSDDFARISTETDDPGTATINCKISRIDGAVDRPIDKPSVQVEFVPSPTITPETVAPIAHGATVDFHAEYEGPYTALWKYTLESPTLGSINRTSLGSSPDCTFTAGTTDGNATIKIEMYLTKGGANHKAYTTTRTVPIGSGGIRVYAHADYWTGTFGSEHFFATGVAYVTVSKSFGTGTYTLYRNGEPIKSWASDGIPAETPLFTGWRVNNANPAVWAVELETRHNNTFTDPNAAESAGRTMENELYAIWVSFGNVYTITVTPE